MNDIDNNREEKDDLWQLLGKVKKNAVSPLFSRNVLREIRSSQCPQGKQPGVFSWLRKRWQLAAVCTLGAILLSANASRLFVHHKTPAPMAALSSEPAADTGKAGDTEVVAHLDELVAYEENSIWLEDSSN